jgi:hypothetical protein
MSTFIIIHAFIFCTVGAGLRFFFLLHASACNHDTARTLVQCMDSLLCCALLHFYRMIVIALSSCVVFASSLRSSSPGIFFVTITGAQILHPLSLYHLSILIHFPCCRSSFPLPFVSRCGFSRLYCHSSHLISSLLFLFPSFVLLTLSLCSPLLPLTIDHHQLSIILDILGTPSIDDFYAITSTRSREYIRALPFRKKQPFAKVSTC